MAKTKRDTLARQVIHNQVKARELYSQADELMAELRAGGARHGTRIMIGQTPYVLRDQFRDTDKVWTGTMVARWRLEPDSRPVRKKRGG